MYRYSIFPFFSFWKIFYYIFLFLHVYGNLFIIIYASFLGVVSWDIKKTVLSIDLLFFISFYIYVLW